MLNGGSGPPDADTMAARRLVSDPLLPDASGSFRAGESALAAHVVLIWVTNYLTASIEHYSHRRTLPLARAWLIRAE
jgi:hypothetical protein